jgi:hypothetical protein
MLFSQGILEKTTDLITPSLAQLLNCSTAHFRFLDLQVLQTIQSSYDNQGMSSKFSKLKYRHKNNFLTNAGEKVRRTYIITTHGKTIQFTNT